MPQCRRWLLSAALLLAVLLVGVVFCAAQQRPSRPAHNQDQDRDFGFDFEPDQQRRGEDDSGKDDVDDDDDEAEPTAAAGGKPGPTSPAGSSSSIPPTAASDDRSDDDAQYDADEFTGFPPKKKPNPPIAADVYYVEPEKPSNYYAEYAALFFIVLYAVNFFVGRSTNDAIAKKWFETFQPIFDLQFAGLGAYEGDHSAPLLKDSQSSYKFYASGRRHCIGLLASLELRRRHDLFSLLLSLLNIGITRDQVTIEVPMSPEEMEPFLFAVVRKRQEKKLRRSHKDMENFGGLVVSKRLPSSLVILTDCPELEREFLDDLVVRTLSQYEDLFVLMHLTDEHAASPFTSKKTLRFVFHLPPPNDMHRLQKLTEMAIHFIDRVAANRLPAQSLARNQKKRKEVADALFRASHEQRQEAAQRRKDEQKRKEEEQAANLTPEQIRKRELKEYKQSLKRKAPKVKIIR